MFEDDVARQNDFAVMLAAGGAALMVMAAGLAVFVATVAGDMTLSGGAMV